MIKCNFSSTKIKRKKKNKTLILIVMILIALNISSAILVRADTASNEVEEQLKDNIMAQLGALNLEQIEQLISQFGQDNKLWGNSSFFDKVVSIISGEFAGGGETFFQAILMLLLGQVVSLLPSLVTIAVIAILCGVITNMKSSGLNGNTSEIVFFACFSIIIIIVLLGVWSLIDVTTSTISNIKLQMNIILPVLITLITAMGGSVSATVYQPAIALLSGGVIEVISLVVMPLFIFSVVFAIISNLSNNVRISKLAEFFRNANSWIIGVTFTVFTAFITVQGLTASTIDGVSVRAAKYAIKNYIPLVGSYLGDGFDLILASTTLIKNAIGVAGLLLLVGTILLPIAQILCYMWGLKLVSAVLEPLCDSRIIKFSSSVSDSIKVLFASLIAVGMMFIIIIMLIIFTCNALY